MTCCLADQGLKEGVIRRLRRYHVEVVQCFCSAHGDPFPMSPLCPTFLALTLPAHGTLHAHLQTPNHCTSRACRILWRRALRGLGVPFPISNIRRGRIDSEPLDHRFDHGSLPQVMQSSWQLFIVIHLDNSLYREFSSPGHVHQVRNELVGHRVAP